MIASYNLNQESRLKLNNNQNYPNEENIGRISFIPAPNTPPLLLVGNTKIESISYQWFDQDKKEEVNTYFPEDHSPSQVATIDLDRTEPITFTIDSPATINLAILGQHSYRGDEQLPFSDSHLKEITSESLSPQSDPERIEQSSKDTRITVTPHPDTTLISLHLIYLNPSSISNPHAGYTGVLTANYAFRLKP